MLSEVSGTHFPLNLRATFTYDDRDNREIRGRHFLLENTQKLVGKNCLFRLKRRGRARLSFSIPLSFFLAIFLLAACSKSSPPSPTQSLQISKKESPISKNVSQKPLLSPSGATTSSTLKISNPQNPAFLSNPSSPSLALSPNVAPTGADRQAEAFRTTGSTFSDNSEGNQNTADPAPTMVSDHLSGNADPAPNLLKEVPSSNFSIPLRSNSALQSGSSGDSGTSSPFIPSVSSSSPSLTSASNGISLGTGTSSSNSTIPAVTSTPAVLPPQTSTFSTTSPPLVTTGSTTVSSTGGTTTTVVEGGTTNLSLDSSGSSTATVSGTGTTPPTGSSNSGNGSTALSALAGGALPSLPPMASNSSHGIMSSGNDDTPVRNGREMLDRVLYGLPGSECNQLFSKQEPNSSDPIQENDPPILISSSKGVDIKLLIQQKEKDPAGNFGTWRSWVFKGWVIRVVFQSGSANEYWDTFVTEKKEGCNADFARLPLDFGDLYVFLAPKVNKPHEDKETVATLTDDEYRNFQKRSLYLGVFKIIPPATIMERPTSSASGASVPNSP